MTHLARTKQILADLIAFPSVSSDGNMDLIAYAARLLEDCGAKVDHIIAPCGTKANLFATLGPEVDGGILLSGHSDVVPVSDQQWASDPFDMIEKDGKLFGRGTCDMKGFIAATLAMAPLYAAKVKDRPVHFAFTYDEEIGCFGAQHLAEVLKERGLTPGVAIIGEPTEMRIIEGHKGCCEYTTHFHGLAGHGSLPDRGVNAVEYAARYVGKILELKDRLRAMAPADSPFEPPWTTINVGALNGGVANNVIPSNAWIDWEMRPVQDGDADFVKEELARYCDEELVPQMHSVDPDAGIRLETIAEVAGLIPTEENEAKRIVSELTGANGADLVAFGTEAGIFQALGTDVVVCGPGSIEQAHKADEYLSLDQLQQCLTMLERLGDRLHG
ncbi:acetylornithine deacetylase [Thalassobius sp. MITS945101]|uniref:acetylornithine deacetylase n=1 Tax=Thalassobius sp. MITS945101 TaxID=3096994 RepID=UPI003999ADFD